jgi:hypothetical protein
VKTRHIELLIAGLLFSILAYAQVVTDVTSTRIRYTGSGVNDNDLLFTASGTDPYTVCMLQSTDGAVDVEARLGDDVAGNWTTAPISLQDMGSTSTSPVLVTVADRMYAIVGKYDGIRVRQAGATAATAFLNCYNSGSGRRQ